MSFEANVGQADPSVKYIAHMGNFTLLLGTSRVTALLSQHESTSPIGPKSAIASKLLEAPKSAVVTLTSLGTSTQASVTGVNRLPGVVNYLVGRDQTKWHRNVATYGSVRIHNLYPGIDMVFQGQSGQMEYQYVIAPGADPSAIRVAVGGAHSTHLDASGDMVIETDAGQFIEHTPSSYQPLKSGRHTVQSSLASRGSNTIGINLGTRDPKTSVVFDPTLSFSSYLGGNSDDQDYSIATDGAGNIYATGYADSTDFPTSNAYQGSKGGGTHDVSITKLAPGGASYVYSTYLGGNGNDVAYALALDTHNNVYIAGMTTSNNYPTANAYNGSYSGSDYDGIVTKLNAAGSALVFSTYIQGNGYDQLDGIAVSSAGNVYVAGKTASSNFPTSSPIQGSYSGNQDAVLFELSSSGSSMIYGTYLGGSGSESANLNCLKIDSAGNAYVSMSTSSSGLATGGSAQSSYGGGTNDDIVYKVNPSGSAVTWATYVGGSADDEPVGLAVDGNHNVYLAGTSYSTDFPSTYAIYGSNAGDYDGTVTEIAADGASFVYSTYIGGSNYDVIMDVAVDSAGDVYFGGYSLSSNVPTINAPQGSYGGGSYDGIYGAITPGTGSSTPVMYVSSYLGGSGNDVVYGIAVDRSENIYLTGLAGGSFPLVNPLQVSYGGNPSDAYIAEVFIGPPVDLIAAEMRAGGYNACQCAGQKRAGDPVDTATGAFSEIQTDISIPGRGIPIGVTRAYDSGMAATDGPFGYGWTFNGNMSISPGTSGSDQTITQENGSQVTFTYSAGGGGTYTPPTYDRATLTYNSGNSTWTFQRNGQNTYTFNTSGELTHEADLNGETTTLAYNTGKLDTMTDSAGRVLTFGWTSTHITSVTDANISPNRTVGYAYDGNGDLTDVTDVEGGDTHFTYSSHLLTVMKDPVCEAAGGGCPGVQNHYTGNDQVDWQKDQLNRETDFAYSGDPATATGSTTTITDPEGNVIVDAYQWNLLISVTKGYGTADVGTTYYGHDPYTFAMTSVTDPNGGVTTMTVDGSGNTLTTTDPLNRTTTMTYNGFNEPLTIKDPTGISTTNTYDGNGNLTQTSRPLAGTADHQVTVYTYGNGSHPGDVTEVTDPDSKNWDFGYDANGYRNSVTDPLGNEATSTYNDVGWKLTDVSPKGNVYGCACAATYTTEYDYTIPGTADTNEFGDVQTITDPLSHDTVFGYDADRRTTSVKDANTNVTDYAFDYAGQLTTTTRPDTSTLVTDYNDDGTIQDQVDGATNTTSYSYDHQARVTTITDPATGNGANDPTHVTTDLTYDPIGNVLTKVQGGNTITYAYDDANQLCWYYVGTSNNPCHDAPANAITYAYNDDGERTSMTDATGTSTWVIDSLHRVTSYENGNGDTVGYQYNLRNLPETITYPGSHDLSKTYDDDGRLHTVTDWLSSPKTTTFAYDENSNFDTVTFPGTNDVDTYAFDAANNLTSMSDANNGGTFFYSKYGRDDNNQVCWETSSSQTGSCGSPPSTDVVQTAGYNSLNQQCYTGTSTPSCSGTPPYTFDSADDLTKMSSTYQSFDTAQQMCWTYTASRSCSSSAPNPGVATRYTYDTRGNRTAMATWTNGSSGTDTCYGFDALNRMTSINTGTGTSCTSPSTVATYAYDGDGLRQSKDVGGTTQFTWDDSSGLPTLLKEGSSRYFIYGPDGQVLEQIDGTTAYFYHHDQIGSVRAVTNASGTLQWSATFDPYGTTTASSNPGGITNPFGFSGQYTDAESGFSYLRARYYDPTTAQFLTRDPMVALTRSAYAYVAGNPLNAVDPAGLNASGLDTSSADYCYQLEQLIRKVNLELKTRYVEQLLYLLMGELAGDMPTPLSEVNQKLYLGHMEALYNARSRMQKLLKEWQDGPCGDEPLPKQLWDFADVVDPALESDGGVKELLNALRDTTSFDWGAAATAVGVVVKLFGAAMSPFESKGLSNAAA